MSIKLGVWDTIIVYEVFESATQPRPSPFVRLSWSLTTHYRLAWPTYQFLAKCFANSHCQHLRPDRRSKRPRVFPSNPTPAIPRPNHGRPTWLLLHSHRAHELRIHWLPTLMPASSMVSFNAGFVPTCSVANWVPTNPLLLTSVHDDNACITGLKFLVPHSMTSKFITKWRSVALVANELPGPRSSAFTGRAEYIRPTWRMGSPPPGAPAGKSDGISPPQFNMTLGKRPSGSRLELRWDTHLSGDNVWGPIRVNETGETAGLINEIRPDRQPRYKF